MVPVPPVPYSAALTDGEEPTCSSTREIDADIAHHKRVVRKIYLDVRSQGNLDLLDDIFDPEYVGYDPTANPPVVRGPDGFREQTRGYRTVFPDLQFSIRSLVAEGDEVIVRWTATATHAQSLMDEPPTGRRIETSGFGSWKFRNGKVVEHWGLIDLLGLREQLGARP
jgi:predicted ester cyclase